MKFWTSWKWSWRRPPGNQPVQFKIGKFGPELALILGLWVTGWLPGGSLQDYYQNVRNFISFRLVPLDVPLSQSTGYFRFHFRSFSGCFDCFSVLLLKDPPIFFYHSTQNLILYQICKYKKILCVQKKTPFLAFLTRDLVHTGYFFSKFINKIFGRNDPGSWTPQPGSSKSDPDSTTPQPGSFPTQIALPLNLGRNDPGDRLQPAIKSLGPHLGHACCYRLISWTWNWAFCHNFLPYKPYLII